MKNIKLIKEVKLEAVFWDGSFEQIKKINFILSGKCPRFCGGDIAYIDKNNEISIIPRNVWVVNDNNNIKYFYQSGDSLLENNYKIL